MSTMTAVPTEAGGAEAGEDPRAGLPVFDTDVHEAFRNFDDMLPYLQEPWRTVMTQSSFKGMNPPYVKWASGGGGRADARPAAGGPPGSDYDLMREQLLDHYNIKKAVLTGYFYPVAMDNMQVELASALAAAYNDYQLEHWLEKDDRLIGSIQIAPQDPEGAAREIDRLGQHPRFGQVMMATSTRAFGEPQYHPIYAAAERNGINIGFHHSTYVQSACGMGRYYIERHMYIPQAMMSQMISLLCNGVLDKFPNIRFMALEGGWTWLPHVLWRMDREYKGLRQEIPWVKKMPSRYFVEDKRMLFSTQPTEDLTADQWLKVQELIGSDDLLCFATDYPHFDFDSPVRSLPARLPEELKRKILFDTAAEFYGDRAGL